MAIRSKHSVSLSFLVISFLLLSRSSFGASFGQTSSDSTLQTRQDDPYGSPYGNSDPWDDTDPDGTGSTTWLPDDYISGDSGSTSSSSSSTEDDTTSESATTGALAAATTSFDSFLSPAPTATAATSDTLDFGDTPASSTASSEQAAFSTVASSQTSQEAVASSTMASMASSTPRPTSTQGSTTLRKSTPTTAAAARASTSEIKPNSGLRNKVTQGGLALVGVVGLVGFSL